MTKIQLVPVGFIVLLFLNYMSGCTGVNSFPVAARGGDTVMFAVGTPEGMKKDNISVTFTSDIDGSVTDLAQNIRALSKFYPSKTSAVALNHSNSIYLAGHEPWLSVLSIDLPLSIPGGGPLPVGSGEVRVQCIPKADCTFPGFFPHTNNVDMALEILPGTGNPHPFKYSGGMAGEFTADPALLEEQPQVTVRPDANGTNTSVQYGAAEYKITMPVTTYNGGAVLDSDIVIVAEDLTTQTGSQRGLIWERKGDDFTIMFSSPRGMRYNEFRFSLVLKPQSSTPSHVYTTAPTLVSEKYYSMDGNQIASAASPVVNVALDYDL